MTCTLLFAFTPRLFCQRPEQQGEARLFGTTHVNIAYSDYVANVPDSPSAHVLERDITYANNYKVHK
jgi:hypothetical protein